MDGWATLWIDTRIGATDVAELVECTRQLDEVAALLALEKDVSGVQTFDAARSETQRPRLCIYTVPAAVAAVSQQAQALLEAFSIEATIRSEVHDDEPWRDAWKRFYRPLCFGDHQLLLRPSFIERTEGLPELEVVLDPGRAFGTGLHQSTQLCLDRLCALAGREFATILDLGCGSGVLALAAARLFPSARITAFDIDPEAIDTAKENAALNGVTSIEFVCGGPDALPDERFDLALCNIRPVVLIPLAPVLRARETTLSGITEDEADNVRAAWTDAGWSCSAQRQRETWVALDLSAAP